MTKIAIVQSNYIPWKGYFDLIAAVDVFILYDQVQFTKNDWRNRNMIKTPQGAQWLSVPVGQDISRAICDVEVRDLRWQEKHWKTLTANYAKAVHFKTVAPFIEPYYRQRTFTRLSELNRTLIEAICGYLSISTKILSSADFSLSEGKTERLVDLCSQVGAQEYVSGPAARSYLDESLFKQRDIRVEWFGYEGYPEYPQLWGDFTHKVSILDLLFNCGSDSPAFMKHVHR